MKRSDAQSIKEIIDVALSQSGVSGVIDEQRVCYLWPEIVGPGINRYTIKRYVERGVLHVYLNSAALKNELQFHRRRLVESLNNAVGKNVITNIIIH